MTIEYEVTEQNYLDFNHDHYKNIKSLRAYQTFLRLSIPALMFSQLFLYPVNTLKILMLSVGISLLWIVFEPRFFKILTERSARRMLKSGKANDFIGEQKLTLAENCIESYGNGVSSNVDYANVEQVCTGHGQYYVYIDAIKALIIPPSAFKDNSEKNAFFELLKLKTGADVSQALALRK